MVSLGYLRLTERLTIVIIRARNLPHTEEEEEPGKVFSLGGIPYKSDRGDRRKF